MFGGQKIATLEKENTKLEVEINDLKSKISQLEAELSSQEKKNLLLVESKVSTRDELLAILLESYGDG